MVNPICHMQKNEICAVRRQSRSRLLLLDEVELILILFLWFCSESGSKISLYNLETFCSRIRNFLKLLFSNYRQLANSLTSPSFSLSNENRNKFCHRYRIVVLS